MGSFLVVAWRSSSRTRGRAWAPCTGSTESQPLDHQGKSLKVGGQGPWRGNRRWAPWLPRGVAGGAGTAQGGEPGAGESERGGQGHPGCVSQGTCPREDRTTRREASRGSVWLSSWGCTFPTCEEMSLPRAGEGTPLRIKNTVPVLGRCRVEMLREQ